MERFSFFGRAKYDVDRAHSGVHAGELRCIHVWSSDCSRRGAVGDFSAAILYGNQIYLPSVVQTATPSREGRRHLAGVSRGRLAGPELPGARRLHVVAGLSRSLAISQRC